ncbi:MAG: hypothetical protein HOV87_09225 [Catenulispora sp.]|nr:hypothetical protein [Catenulispora sp.]
MMIEVSTRNPDRLAAIATWELGGASLDSALEILLFEHESLVALGRLSPRQLGALTESEIDRLEFVLRRLLDV